MKNRVALSVLLAFAAPAFAASSFPTLKRPDNLADFIRDETAAAQLGKAFFWDMQSGSDGRVACATCHHVAFSDSRRLHQFAPGPNRLFESGSLNQRAGTAQFPIDTDDVFGSQGVIKARFKDIVLGEAEEEFEPLVDRVFHLNGKNLRQVTALNSPSVILAAFNHRNFWDGRAREIFNGVTPFGDQDPAAEGKIWRATSQIGGLSPRVVATPIRIEASSAASQAVGPLLDGIEMSYRGRTWPKVAKKLFHLTPLGKQEVHLQDSLLGDLSKFPAQGLSTDYRDLIERAFHPEWWRSSAQFTLNKNGKPRLIRSQDDLSATDVFDLMEVNFSLFWGLAIQAYESTLVSDETPMDQFKQGVRTRSFSQRVERGMALFNGKAECASCHRENLLAAATHENIDKLGVSISRFQADQKEAFLDTGFFNIAVRPTEENLGIGGLTPFNTPLSFSKATRPGKRLAIDGAFKAPGLRNVALTGPYFHNGGKLTLDQVLDFYQTKGDFFDLNFKNINVNLVKVEFNDDEQKDLEAFLRVGLTDLRVADERAPFDHPDLKIPHGYGPRGKELFDSIPAVGARGRRAEGLQTLIPFLGDE